MLKTISAALLAVSVLAAPALAAAPGKTADAPLIKTIKDTQAKTAPAKASALNANAKMGQHHRKHLSYHHRHHRKMTAFNSHTKTKLKTSPKVSMKPAAPATKRG